MKCIAYIAVAGFAVGASAQVIDFEVLEHNDSGTTDHGYSYQEDGFTVFHDTSEPFTFLSWGTESPNYPGSTAMFNNTIDGITQLKKDDGSAFNLTSIDLATLFNFNNGDSVTIPFSGFLGGNLVATQSFVVVDSDPFELSTFFFNDDFSDVDLVTWTQATPFHQFDNITITPVPTPAGVALLGLGGLVATRRRR